VRKEIIEQLSQQSSDTVILQNDVAWFHRDIAQGN